MALEQGTEGFDHCHMASPNSPGLGPTSAPVDAAVKAGNKQATLERARELWEQSLEGVGTLRVNPQPPAPAYALYTVRRGDTLSMIADRHGVSVTALQSLNGLGGRSQIRTGQVLRIPAG